MARADAGELQMTILNLWGRFYRDKPREDQARLRVLLKAKLLDSGYCVYDTVRLTKDDCVRLGVVGVDTVAVCEELAALRPQEPSRNAGAAASG